MTNPITRELVTARRDEYLRLASEYHRQAVGCEGAAQAMDELLELLPMTITELGEALGAAEIGEPQEVDHAQN